jgi:hypothetical protein
MIKHFTVLTFIDDVVGLHSSDCTVELWNFSSYAAEFFLCQAVYCISRVEADYFTSILDLGFYPMPEPRYSIVLPVARLSIL